MPPLLPLILARSEEGDFFKILFGVAVVAFWIIKAITSAVADQKKKIPPARRAPANLPRPGYGGATNPPFPPRVPPLTATAAAAQKSRQRSQKKRAPTPFAAAPVPALPVQPVPAPARSAPPPPQSPSRPVTQQVAPNAARVGRLLRRPDTLRAALILNEVLSPPLALREPRQQS